MTNYRIRFLNDLPDSTGHVHACCQRTIEVSAACKNDAVTAAKATFEALEAVPDWQLHARRTQCERLAGKVTLEEAMAK